MSTTYQFPSRGLPKFQVRVGDDGAIKVRPNDCLSKYSMAIHGRGDWTFEYGRSTNGNMVPLQNVHQIKVGETIYHLPTYTKFRRRQTPTRQVMDFSGGPAFIVKKRMEPPSDAVRQQILNYLVNDLKWSRYKANALTVALWSCKLSAKAIQIAAWNTIDLICWHSAWSGAAMMAAPLMALVGCVKGLIKVINTKNDYTRALAFCHGATAYLFGHSNPCIFPDALRRQYASTQDNEWPNLLVAWREGTRSGFEKARQDSQTTTINGKQVKPEVYCALMRFMADNKPAKLCEMIHTKVVGQLNSITQTSSRNVVSDSVKRLIKNGFGYHGKAFASAN